MVFVSLSSDGWSGCKELGKYFPMAAWLGDGVGEFSAFHTSGRNWSSWLIGVVPILANTLVRYACGSRP